MRALYDAVYADPEADEPRRELAAALLATGDPRGELIELQLDAAAAGKVKRAVRSRITALLAEHQGAWLGDLDGVLVKKSVQWERGFPAAGRLSSAQGPPDRWIGLPALATLRRLELWFGNVVLPSAWAQRFVLAHPLRHLRELRHIGREVLPRMLRDPEPRPLQRLDLLGAMGRTREQEEALAQEVGQAFAEGEGLPLLRDLSLSFLHLGAEAYEWVFSTAAGKRLESLQLNANVRMWIEWRERLEDSDVALRTLCFFDRMGTFSIERTGAGWTRITGKLGTRLPPGWSESFDAFVNEVGFDEDEVKRP